MTTIRVEPVIEACGLGKRYRRPRERPRRLGNLSLLQRHDQYWALRDVSFAIARGETIGLIGRNGSGKSTLLRVLAGLTRHTTGKLAVRQPVSGLLTLGEGFHPLMSGRENAITGAILAGSTRREALGKLDAITAFAELDGHMEQPLRMYSDGMRLRLAFAVSVHIAPQILLIDEVLAVGDLRFRDKCLRQLEQMQAGGVTIILASHDMDQVRRLCGRVQWLADGHLRMLDDTQPVVEAYERSMNEGLMPETIGTDGQLRLGSGEVEVVDARILDTTGCETARIRSGSPVTVEIDLLARDPLPDAIVSVAVHPHPNGAPCLDLSTDSEGQALGRLDGPATVRLHLARLDLGGGCYWLDVGVFEASWARTYDYRWQFRALEVAAPGRPGRLHPPHHWSVK